MNPRLIAVLLFAATSAHAVDYPAQAVSLNAALRFGQTQAEVEKAVGKKAVRDTSIIARADKDTKLELPWVILSFDTGRLSNMRFTPAFNFNFDLAPYPEAWRNFTPIGTIRLKRGMKKAEVLAYLGAWEERAKQLGASRYEGDRLLREGEYSRSETVEDFIDSIHIGFGPQRSTGRGGSWGDGAGFSFVTASTASLDRRPAGSLDDVTFFCDEFNTNARRPFPPPFVPPVAVPIEREAVFEGKFDTPDEMSLPVSTVAPVYPLAFQRANLPGEAMIAFVVEADGTTAEVQYTKATDQAFADAAIAAVKQWKFKPPTKGGQPIRYTVSAPIVFTLGTGPAAFEPGRMPEGK